jgi:hypothetical protein
MSVGVKKKEKSALTPVFPKTVDLEKKPRGRPSHKKLKDQIEEKELLEDLDTEDIPIDSPDDAETNNFMQDLLWVYNKLGGKKTLLKRAQRDKNVRNQVFQTLLRMETKKQENEGKQRLGKNGKEKRGLLLVMKGLEDDQKGIKIGEGKVSRKDVMGIIEPGSDMNEEGVQDTSKYEYDVQEMSGEEAKKVDPQGQDQDSERREEESAGTEDIIMDEVIDA